MVGRKPTQIVDQNICSVKAFPGLNTQFPLFPDTVRHHSIPTVLIGNKDKLWKLTAYYGISADYRILTKELMLKRFDQVRDCLELVLGLTNAEREFILRMLRLWAYYGKCYPTVASLCREPGCSKASAWRALDKLKSNGLIQTINRYLKPYRRQISNLYLFHKLLIVIARYLAEHGQQFYEKHLQPFLEMSGAAFWGAFAFGLSPGSASLQRC